MDRIVVGYDGSPNSRAATAVALAEARRRGATIEVVYAWSPLHRDHRVPDDHGTLPPLGDDESEVARAWVAEALAELSDGAEPPVEVAVRVTTSATPARAVLEAAEGALLVVVGSRGRQGVRSAVLGSVSQRILADAACPVLVVPRQAVAGVLADG